MGAGAGPPNSDLAQRGDPCFYLTSPQQEVQNIFKAKHPMDTEITKAKVRPACGRSQGGDTASGSSGTAAGLFRDRRAAVPLVVPGPLPPAPVSVAQIIGFGSALLEEVDPNPANFVGAGIIHTKTTQIGCLLRLEPNLQAQVRLLRGIAESV